MSDQGEKTCPLCAEEMDLTDQQLKPCKCGYEICVWCWHHIMDMAEKDGVEGRCPACRTLYNKEKIVGTAAQCKRLAAEMGVEKKTKTKPKSKTPDGRKQLSSARVIQRNLVYIVGLPLNLADEDLLQRKEYFAQYGKVLKVSISRTAAGTIQHFANNTCSVYITYSKEEEAVRCIQSVNGFTLEGKPLRACFGTTKYCHAWLRSLPCSNPDCLYLHEFSSQEDSFTKDEIISAYTRTRVQQVTGASYDTQRRSGNLLPPPVDDYCNNGYSSTGKPNSKIAADNIDVQSDDILGASVWLTPASSVRGSPPDSSSGRPVGLPAAASWVVRASNSQPSCTTKASSNDPFKKKAETCSRSVAFSTVVVSSAQVPTVHRDVGKQLTEESLETTEKSYSDSLESVKLYMDGENRRTTSVTSAMHGHTLSSVINNQLCTKAHEGKSQSVNTPTNLVNSFGVSEHTGSIGEEIDANVNVKSEVQKLCYDMLSLSIDRRGSQGDKGEPCRELLTLSSAQKNAALMKDDHESTEQSKLRVPAHVQAAESAIHEVDDDLLSFNGQRKKDQEYVTNANYSAGLSGSVNLSDSSRVSPPHPPIVDEKLDKVSPPNAYSTLVRSYGSPDNRLSSVINLNSSDNHSYKLPLEGKNAFDHIGESSIISDILSMEFDPWDESLASPQNLVKLLGEGDKSQGSLGVSGSWKVHNTNQSRFAFAREDDPVPNIESSLSNFGQSVKNHSLGNDFVDSRNFYLNNTGNHNGFSAFSAEDPGNFACTQSPNSSNNISASRAPVSAPPGFSGLSRAPPPGFTDHKRMEQTFDVHSGSYLLETSTLRKPYQAAPAVMNMNIGSAADIEFIDPAILAVGKGRLAGGLNSPVLEMRSPFPPQLTTYEDEARLQLLMQRSLAPQNNRYSEMRGSFSSRPDRYGITSRIMEQTMTNDLSQLSQYSLPQSRNQQISNGNCDGWSKVTRGNDSSVAELIRTERLGINKFNGYEDSRFRMPSSGDLYNRTYGI